MRVAVLLASAVALGAGPAAAQEALYGPQPPKGSAYVRFVNALPVAAALTPDFLPAEQLGTGPADRVGAYFAVERVAGRALQLDIQAGGKTGHATLQADPGGFLTIVVQQTQAGALAATPIADLAEFNQNRARLSFYNATADCPAGTLALDPGGQAVFQDVPAGGAKARSVNPVNAQLRASCTGRAAPPVTLGGMEPGSMFSVWLMAPDGKPTAFVTRDVATPYRP